VQEREFERRWMGVRREKRVGSEHRVEDDEAQQWCVLALREAVAV
jgi:hypothetical protein